MESETLNALKGSIRKWHRIWKGEDRDRGRVNCDLCLKFNTVHMRENQKCRGCPVMENTGQQYCESTPWAMLWKYIIGNYIPDMPQKIWPEARAAAKAERDYLISLLPYVERQLMLDALKKDNGVAAR